MPKPMPGGLGYVATNARLMAMVMGACRLTETQILGPLKADRELKKPWRPLDLRVRSTK